MTTLDLTADIKASFDNSGNPYLSSQVEGLALDAAYALTEDNIYDIVAGIKRLAYKKVANEFVFELTNAAQEDWRDKLSAADLRLIDHCRKEEEAMGVFDWCHNWAA